MEQLIDTALGLFSSALGEMSGRELLTILGAYGLNPLIVFFWIQRIKVSRARGNDRRLGDWTLRGIAFTASFVFALFIVWRLGGWPLAQAVDHAMVVAIAYPLVIFLWMLRLRKKHPEAAEALADGSINPTEWRR